MVTKVNFFIVLILLGNSNCLFTFIRKKVVNNFIDSVDKGEYHIDTIKSIIDKYGDYTLDSDEAKDYIKKITRYYSVDSPNEAIKYLYKRAIDTYVRRYGEKLPSG